MLTRIVRPSPALHTFMQPVMGHLTQPQQQHLLQLADLGDHHFHFRVQACLLDSQLLQFRTPGKEIRFQLTNSFQ